jgi:hypothetical protein
MTYRTKRRRQEEFSTSGSRLVLARASLPYSGTDPHSSVASPSRAGVHRLLKQRLLGLPLAHHARHT